MATFSKGRWVWSGVWWKPWTWRRRWVPYFGLAELAKFEMGVYSDPYLEENVKTRRGASEGPGGSLL
jgi:hypothetical protein